MNSNQENLNKKVEESKKVFEKIFGGSCSYHEDDRWGRKDGVFTIKLEKNMKILNDFEKALGNGQPVNFEIKDLDGELRKVSKEEFANWMVEGKEEKNVKTPPKESLVYGASGDIDGTEIYVERKGKDGFFKESYYESRSEEEKKQIIERNKKRREQEKFRIKNSPIQNEKDQSAEKKTNQQNLSQKLENKNNSSKNVYFGVGVIFLALVAISMMIVWVKRRNKLK